MGDMAKYKVNMTFIWPVASKHETKWYGALSFVYFRRQLLTEQSHLNIEGTNRDKVYLLKTKYQLIQFKQQ